VPIFFLYSFLLMLPIVKKEEWREQFNEMLKSFKTLGF